MNQIRSDYAVTADAIEATVNHGSDEPVAVVGLGYVGLPLAIALGRNRKTIGFDVDHSRIAELTDGVDRTGEASPQMLEGSDVFLTDDANELGKAAIIIVTVPTPVTDDNEPDLSLVKRASEMVGKVMKKGCIVVYESTVYPGVTEDICGPTLEKASGMLCGKDFFLGYSPERINPGDKIHTVDKITKVVAGQNKEVSRVLCDVYASVTTGGVFEAASIRAAEAAKVIENAQRDINIAFINEVASIFLKMGINTNDVLDAANTKWNFLDFRPGLVGGHCIGVDPFYLAHAAKMVGQEPEIILSGRRINDQMPSLIAESIHRELTQETYLLSDDAERDLLVLGITFKENCPDIRNSKAATLVRALMDLGHNVDVWDPYADPEEVYEEYGIQILTSSPLDAKRYDGLIATVPHGAFSSIGLRTLAKLIKPGGLAADIKGMWRLQNMPDGIRRWQL